MARAASFLGLGPADVIDHEWGVNGPDWAMLQLASDAAVAQWLRGKGVVPPRYTAVQGGQLGAAGEVRIDDDGADVWVGGRAVTVIDGTVLLNP